MREKSPLSYVQPFDRLDVALRAQIEACLQSIQVAPATKVIDHGDRLDGLYIIQSGRLEMARAEGAETVALVANAVFGDRELLRAGISSCRLQALEATQLLLLPKADFERFMQTELAFANCFDPTGTHRTIGVRPTIADGDLTTTRLADFMTPDPITIDIAASVRDAARLMRDNNISCVLVTEQGKLAGIVTTGDLTDRVLAEGRDGSMPLASLMTRDPFSLPSDALGFDAFLVMTEHRFGHLPVVDDGRIVGILTRTNIIRRRSVSAVAMIAKIAKRHRLEDIRAIVSQIPQLLVQLADGGAEPHTVGRLITGIADATTRRLIRLAENELGPAPIAYVWAACGSQGRMEQTGVSDQDNCLILDDSYDEASHGAYFEKLAKHVSDGLDACGYYFCPGDMMATNPRWRTHLARWRSYFSGWIDKPDPMAQMLSSVMFDLRPIHGERHLLDQLQAETLAKARANSIFMAHMIGNSLKHSPPLGLFGGLSTIRSGEHKERIDLKISGVVPIVDLGRIYALKAASPVANTRERLQVARDAKIISASGAADLLDAYELISDMRLQHQARQARHGMKIDNFMSPGDLSELERNHLRDAFAVVKTMQSAVGQHVIG